MSFLFDIKKAANIDDQTLYYLCLKGIQEAPADLQDKLQPFEVTLLSKDSIDFYRGTKTKDVLQNVDQDLERILMTLAPYWMLPCTHKILEYLIRIYEVHAHLKHTLILSFFAYFETSYFLKAI